MSTQGLFQDGHAPANRYALVYNGAPFVTAFSVTGLSWSRDMGTLPDRRKVSGGVKQAFEISISIPAHHALDVAKMRSWGNGAEWPCAPDYKRDLTLIRLGIHGGPIAQKTLKGCWVAGKDETDGDATDEGNPVMYTYKISVDQEVDVF